MTFQDLFEAHAAASLEKQLDLSALIGTSPWQVDLDEGTISFGDRHVFPIQVLGTEAEETNTWLWAWANYESDIPSQLVQSSEQLRQFGTTEGIAELTEAELPLGRVTGHQLGLVATGFCQTDCYYRGPYEGGAAYLLIEAPVLRRNSPTLPVRMINVYTQLIASYAVNHRRALVAYLRTRGYTIADVPEGLVATGTDGSAIRAMFDSRSRLSKISTTARP